MRRKARSRAGKIISGGWNSSFFIVAPAEIFFQPDVGADEQIAAAHLLDLQFRLAETAVAPGDRHHRSRITAHDGLEWNLHRKIKMWRDERLATRDDRAPVSFERIRRVVQRNLENAADKKIGEPVHEQLHLRIINHAAALDEPAAEHAVPA